MTGKSLGLYRYVIKCYIKDHSEKTIGSGIGSCSTLESKYIDRPRDMENTVLKMAQKRALVAATLNAFGLSDRFTQDMVEDEDTEAVQVNSKGYDPANKKHSDWLLKELQKPMLVQTCGMRSPRISLANHHPN